jgi:hypothetical protein
MSDASSRLAAALSDRYRLERAAESRGSADVAEATGESLRAASAVSTTSSRE